MKPNNFTSPAPLAAERAPYAAPSIEVIDVVTEGVIAGSGGGSVISPPDYGNGGGAWSSSNARSSYGASPASGIEDMITDILTIEQ